MKRYRVSCVSLMAVAIATSAAAQEASSPEAGSSESAAGPSEQSAADAIVVTGIRGSIERAINTKRLSANIVDAISAEDIGKLPDQNIAESLGRITGVQISRREGEGASFTVRGISLNRVEINGRSFVGPTQDATPALDTLNPEILSSIEVVKSPSASMVEGALGATVNLKTRRPLDTSDDFLVSGRAQVVYADNAEAVGYRASMLVSKHFADDTLGVLAGVAYGRIKGRGEGYFSAGFTRSNAIDTNGDGVGEPNLIRPNRLALEIEDRRDRRLTANAAIQWQPDDDTDFVVEGTYSRFRRQRDLTYFQTILNNNYAPGTATVLADGTIAAGTVRGVTLRPLVYDAPVFLQTKEIGASLRRQFGRLEMVVDGSYSSGKQNGSSAAIQVTGAPFTFVVVNKPSAPVNVTYDLRANRNVPDFSLSSPADLNDSRNFQLGTVVDLASLANNRGYDGKIDLNYQIESGIFTALRSGVRYENIRLNASDPASQPSAAQLLAVADRNGDGIIDVAELPSLDYDNRYSGNFLEELSGNFPRNFLSGNVDNAAGRLDVGLNGPARAPLTERQVNQETVAGFVQLDMSGDTFGLRWSGNIGVRYVNTTRRSSGNAQTATPGTFAPVSFKSKFTDWLPSANLTVNLSNDLLVRLAASKVVARPPLDNVSAGITVFLPSFSATAGNPLLKPFKATQYDASVEWYFNRRSLLSLALFYKDVNSFTTTTVTSEIVPGNESFGPLAVSRPQNGESGSVKGVELGLSTTFDFLPGLLSGFGTQISYTYADSKTPIVDELTQRTLPLQNLSKHSYSAVLFYEMNAFSARLAYTYRTKYLLANQAASLGGSITHAPYSQLDASFTYRLNDRYQLTFDAINLTKPFDRYYQGTALRTREAFLSDRRFQFGILAKF